MVAISTVIAAVSLAITVASISYQQVRAAKLKKKAKKEADARKGFEVVVEASSEPMPVVYGLAKIGGVRVFHQVGSEFKYVAPNSDKVFLAGQGTIAGVSVSGVSSFSPNGDPILDVSNFSPIDSAILDHSIPVKKARNEYLFYQQALCHGPINAAWDILIDDTRTLADPTFGNFEKPHKSTAGDPSTAIRVDVHYGATTEACAVMSANFPEREEAKFPGLTYASAVIKINRDNPEFSRAPDIQFLIEGRLVRTVTAGVLSVSRVYSNNPAWCLLDYLLDAGIGKGVDESELDLTTFEAVAAICDTVVLPNAPTGGQIYQPVDGGRNITSREVKLYECNIVLDSSKEIRENVQEILSTMGSSRLLWSQGTYKLILQYPTPDNSGIVLANTLTDDDLVLGQEIDLKWPTTEERLNRATVRYNEATANFAEQTVSWPPKVSGTSRRGVGGIAYPVADGRDWEATEARSKLLNSYAVWNGATDTTSLSWAFVPNATGAYTFRLSADNHATLWLDASPVIIDYTWKAGPDEGTAIVNLTADQEYQIHINADNSGGIKGVGAVLVAADGSYVWTTRSIAYSSFDVLTVTDAVYQAMLLEDGGVELEVDTFENGVTDYYHALALAEAQVRTSRSAVAITFSYHVTDNYLEPGDIIKLESDTLGVGFTPELFILVDEVTMREGNVAEVQGLRFDYTQLAWNVADDVYIKPPNLFNSVVPQPEWITFSAPGSLLNDSSGELAWAEVSDSRVASYILYVHAFDDLNADGRPIWRELGRDSEPPFVLPLLSYPSALFGVRALTTSGSISALTVTQGDAVPLGSNPSSRLVEMSAAPNIAFIKDELGVFNTNTITLTSTPIGFLNPRYRWYKDGVELVGETTGILAVSSFDPTVSHVFRSEVQEVGWPDDVFKAYDAITIFSLLDGGNTLSMGFDPANVVVSADAVGIVAPGEYPITVNTLVARGATVLTTGVTYSRLDTGVVSSIDVNTGVITITGITANNADIIVTATVEGTPHVRKLLISKALAGTSESSKFASLSANSFFFLTGGDVNDTPAPATLTVLDTSPGYTSPVRAWYIDGVLQVGETGDSLVIPAFGASLAGKEIRLDIEESDTSSPSTDKLTVYSIKDGANSYVAWFDDQFVNIPVDGNGAIKAGTLPHINQMNVYKGGIDVTTTTGIAYTLSSSQDIVATVNPTTGAVTTTAVTGSRGTYVVRATDPSGFTGLIKFSYAKTNDGVDGSAVFARIGWNSLGFITPEGFGAVPAPTSLTFSDDSNGYVSPVYQWYVDDVIQHGQTSSTFVLPSFPADGSTKEVRLDIDEVGGGSAGADRITIFSLRDGSDAYAVSFVDSNMVLPLDEFGAIASGELPRSNPVIVFKGGQNVTSSIGIVYALVNVPPNMVAVVDSNTGVVQITSADPVNGAVVISGTTVEGFVGTAQFQVVMQESPAKGDTAYEDTVDFRNINPPTNQPTLGSVDVVQSAVGVVDITLNWFYTQGALRADNFALYFESGVTTPTLSSAMFAMVDGDTRSWVAKGVPMDASLKAGIVALRSTRDGPKGGAIVAPWTYTASSANITANIDGTPPSGLKNSAITLGTDGILYGAGGGSVTIAGLGYLGHLSATQNTGSFANLSGKVTAANAATYFSANSLESTYIANLGADKILAGTLAAGVIYAGDISANQITAGTMTAITLNAGNITGASGLDITGQAKFNGSVSDSGYTASVHVNSGANALYGIYCRDGASNGAAIVANGITSGADGVSCQAVGPGGRAVHALGVSGAVALALEGAMTTTSTTLVANLYAARAQTVDSFTGTVPGSNITGSITAATIPGGNVAGIVASASVSNSTGFILGANVSGAVSQATWAQNALNATVASSAVNATYATTAGSANSVSGANVSGAVASATNATNATTASNANSLGGVTSSSWARIFPTNSGTANAAGAGLNIRVTGALAASFRTRGTSNFVYIEQISDKRLKSNIEDERLGLEFVKSLQPRTYNTEMTEGRKAHGLIAQEVVELLEGNDNLACDNGNGTMGVDYSGMVSPLIKAIQELNGKVERLEKELKDAKYNED